MELNKEKLILFQSTHHSIKAKNIMSKNGLKFRTTAVPPVISSDCGSAISTEVELEVLKTLFDENNVLVEAIYAFKKSSGNKEYKKIYNRD